MWKGKVLGENSYCLTLKQTCTQNYQKTFHVAEYKVERGAEPNTPLSGDAI